MSGKIKPPQCCKVCKDKTELALGGIVWSNPESDEIPEILRRAGINDRPLFVPAYIVRKQMTHIRADLSAAMTENLHIRPMHSGCVLDVYHEG
ncbi:hypothetical protein [Nitrosomonas aestuarii]|uniref:hypothetical protein n=1 Tax=Nitrosomonas aestuarii TaxID=52441 RepID=UPI000D31B18E|nr:hypothetical protein [Nitrosomonas aestuarii]PTN10727.1 hypothetical protein C8R11_11923 [Nitrosomonas aestuarii]